MNKNLSHILCTSSVGSLLDAMKWLIPYISHSFDVFRHVENSGGAVKWVLQSFIGTSVTYNGCNCLFYGNYNLDLVGVLDRRISNSTYVLKYCFERHVGGGVIP